MRVHAERWSREETEEEDRVTGPSCRDQWSDELSGWRRNRRRRRRINEKSWRASKYVHTANETRNTWVSSCLWKRKKIHLLMPLDIYKSKVFTGDGRRCKCFPVEEGERGMHLKMICLWRETNRLCEWVWAMRVWEESNETFILFTSYS